MQGEEVEQLVYQAVHMNYNGALMDTLHKDAPAHNRLVFIGKHLDEEALRREFYACVR